LSVSYGPPTIEYLERFPPLVWFDAQEMIALPLLQERDTLGHLGVADDDSGLRFGAVARPVECLNQSVNVVAVHTLHVPAKSLEAGLQRLEAGYLGCGAVCLLIVDIDDPDQII
jgi:hypothetical protein